MSVAAGTGGLRADVVCVGGGVIGLSTALELARRGLRVAVLERGRLAEEASWAGAGILHPAHSSAATTDDQRLRAVSFEAYPELARWIAERTGVDIGLRATGGILLAQSRSELAELRAAAGQWSSENIAFEAIDERRLRALEPQVRGYSPGYYLPGIRQVRNPWLLRGLIAACGRLGVRFFENVEVKGFDRRGETLLGVSCKDGTSLSCGAAVVAVGAWSRALVAEANFDVPVGPIRGQILALDAGRGLVRHILEVGRQYLVPRDEGLVLVGSTEEDVGFDKRTTEAALVALRAFAAGLFPSLAAAPARSAWAGLRPASRLGYPLIGRVPTWRNLWLAAGHFRQGIQLAPGTARLLADWMTTGTSFAAPDSFLPGRRSGPFSAPFDS